MIFAVGVSLIALSGCTALPQVCSGSAEPMVTAEMLFGRKVGDRLGVSEAAFANFAALSRRTDGYRRARTMARAQRHDRPRAEQSRAPDLS